MTETSRPHLPNCAPISAYGNGGFRFGDMSHIGSLLVVPSGMYTWQASSPSQLLIEDFTLVFEAIDQIEVLLVGTGASLMPLPKSLRIQFEEAGLYPEMMDTGAAARTYNVLLAEGRSVAAALIAVDNAFR